MGFFSAILKFYNCLLSLFGFKRPRVDGSIVAPEEPTDGSVEVDTVDLLLREALSGIMTPGRVLWGIDAGHNAGVLEKRSPRLEDGSIFYEWKSNIDFALELADLCDRVGIVFIFTNPDPESTDPDDLSARSRILIDADTDLSGKAFLSLHSNAARTPDLDTWAVARGSETWIYSGADERTFQMAEILNQKMALWSGSRNDRGVKRGNFAVLRECWQGGQIPAFLMEPEFHNDRDGVELLQSAEWRTNYLIGLVRAMALIEQRFF